MKFEIVEPTGPFAVMENVIGSPFGSVAESGTSRTCPSVTDWFPGFRKFGGWFRCVTVIVVVVLSVPPLPSDTITVSGHMPTWLLSAAGVQLNAPDDPSKDMPVVRPEEIEY